MIKKVAYQGEEGSFSHIALMQLFGASCACKGYVSFRDAFEACEREEVDLVLLPIENSLIGPIEESRELIDQGCLKIVGKTQLRIEHALLVLPQATLEQIKKVLSHPKALAQCSQFFQRNSWIKATPFYDTAGAAKEVARRKDRSCAAIAHCLAADLYGLEVLQPFVEDRPDNFTRFLLLSKNELFVSPCLEYATFLAKQGEQS